MTSGADQRPSIGRIVHYWPDGQLDGWWLERTKVPREEGPLAAIVTSVALMSDGNDLVTLTVFQSTTAPVVLPRMVLRGAQPGCWSWPQRD